MIFRVEERLFCPKREDRTFLQKVSYYHILKMEAAGCSGTLVPIYRTKWQPYSKGDQLIVVVFSLVELKYKVVNL
jgi:hypothetical protein